MVGARGRRVKAAFALVLLTSCFWRSYGRVAAVHVDVLVAVARKGADLLANGRLSAESMPELTYPLERAEAFARTATARSGSTPPPSLVAFTALLAHYREFLDVLDQARRTARGDEARRLLGSPLAAVEASGEAVRTALHAEGY